MNAKELLEKLTEAYAQRDVLNIDHAQARDNAIPDEVEAVLADIDTEYQPKLDVISEKIAQLEEQAKAAVLVEGESVKAGALHAVYSKGRISWDGKKLDGMMSLIPQLKAARKEGEPSVTLRKTG